MLRYLARHPDTARNLAAMLCRRLVSDTPSSALISAVADAYLKNDTAIVPTVSTILRSSEFWRSRGAKMRRPTENLIAALRVLGIPVTDWGKALDSLSWMTESLGHRPLDWPYPNGYPDVTPAGVSSGILLATWRYHLGVAAGWYDGFGEPDQLALYGGMQPATSGEAIRRLTATITGKTWPSARLAVLQQFLGEAESTPLASSRLRWLSYPLVAILLDSPHFALR